MLLEVSPDLRLIMHEAKENKIDSQEMALECDRKSKAATGLH